MGKRVIEIDAFDRFNNEKEGGYILFGQNIKITFKNRPNSGERTVIIEDGNNCIEICISKFIASAVLCDFFTDGYDFELDKFAGF